MRYPYALPPPPPTHTRTHPKKIAALLTFSLSLFLAQKKDSRNFFLSHFYRYCVAMITLGATSGCRDVDQRMVAGMFEYVTTRERLLMHHLSIELKMRETDTMKAASFV